MALKDIIKAILEEAQKQANEIKEKSLKKVREIEQEYKKKVNQLKERIESLSKEEEKQIFSQARITAQLLHKNKILAKKQELMSQVFKQSLDKLTTLPKHKEIEFLVLLLNRVPKLKDQIYLLPAKGKEKVIEAAIKKTKKNFILSKEKIEAKGGFVLRSKEQDIDCTYETLLKEKREELEIKIAQILFK